MIGFKLFRLLEPPPAKGAGGPLFAVKDVEVPEAMRDDLAFVQRALAGSSDKVGNLLREEVESLRRQFRLLQSPQLVLAPVGIRAVQERLRALGGEFGRKAGAAYLLTAPVTEAFLGAGLEGRHAEQSEQSVTAFNELIASTPPELSDEWLLFHLRNESLLLRHLAATLEAEHRERRR